MPLIDPVHEIEKRLEQVERLLRRMENILAQSGALLGAANEPNPVTEWMAETRAFLGEEETPNDCAQAPATHGWASLRQGSFL